jgi:hypothetical protein
LLQQKMGAMVMKHMPEPCVKDGGRSDAARGGEYLLSRMTSGGIGSNADPVLGEVPTHVTALVVYPVLPAAGSRAAATGTASTVTACGLC